MANTSGSSEQANTSGSSEQADTSGFSEHDVPNYDTSMDDEQKVLSEPPKKRKSYVYNREEIFESMSAALEFISAEKCWVKKITKPSQDGDKIHFRCNRVKTRGQQCSAAVYLNLDRSSFRVFLYRREDEHDCGESSNQSGSRMSDEVKEIIEQQYDMNKKTLGIIDHLAKLKLPLPSRNQVNNHISAYRRKKYGRPTVSVEELRIRLEKFTEFPEENDTPYVVHDLCGDGKYFRFFMTTKSLTQKSLGARVLCADATYKLMWQGFPLLLVGTTDIAKRFHLIGLMVSFTEQQADFAYLFNSVKNCAFKFFNETIAPDTILCDAAKAISNGFREVFGDDSTTLMCWAHMTANIKNKLKTEVKNSKTRDEIRNDLNFIQAIATVEQFQTALALFLEKWSEEEEFIKYFKSTWVESNPNWYEGIKQHVPSTNNALEATNRVIKDEFSHRDRLSIAEFIHLMATIVGQYSRRCDRDLELAKEPKIDKHIWLATYVWTKLNLKIKTEDNTSTGDIFVNIKSAKFKSSVSVKNSDWLTFEEFKVFYKNKVVVTLPKGETMWKKAWCTCPFFQKQFVCKHVLGIAVRFRQITIPHSAKNVMIGNKRKRGRPSQATKALLTQ